MTAWCCPGLPASWSATPAAAEDNGVHEGLRQPCTRDPRCLLAANFVVGASRGRGQFPRSLPAGPPAPHRGRRVDPHQAAPAPRAWRHRQGRPGAGSGDRSLGDGLHVKPAVRRPTGPHPDGLGHPHAKKALDCSKGWLQSGPGAGCKSIQRGRGVELDASWSLSLAEARDRIEDWKRHLYGERPHSALGHLTPQGLRQPSSTSLKGRVAPGPEMGQDQYDSAPNSCPDHSMGLVSGHHERTTWPTMAQVS